MHEHDYDVIAACADGSASPAELERGRVAMSECAECAAEYRAQRGVLEVLRGAPAVHMTDLERASLHRTIAAALPEPKVGWFTRFAPRIAAVAAGLAVVGLASVAMLQRTGMDTTETAAVEIAADLDEATRQELAPGSGTDGETFLQEEAGADAAFDDTAEAPTAAAIALEEIDASTLEEYAVRLLEDEQPPELFEEALEMCRAALPADAHVTAAGEVLYEGVHSFVFVYDLGAETRTAAVKSATCDPVMDITVGG